MKTQLVIQEISEQIEGSFGFNQLLLDIQTESYCKGCYAARSAAEQGQQPWNWADLLFVCADEVELEKQFRALNAALPEEMELGKEVLLEFLIDSFRKGFVAAARLAEKKTQQLH